MNAYYVGGMPISDELCHHGIKGQKWGVRRYQNPDGTLTEAGKQRYSTDSAQKKFADKVSRAKDLGPSLSKYSPQMRMTMKGIASAANRVKEARDENNRQIDKFFRDKELYNEYENRAISELRGFARKHSDEYGYVNDMSDKQLKNSDYLQGSFDPYEMFLGSKDKRAKPLQDSIGQLIEAERSQHNAVKKYAETFLGSYGNVQARRNTGSYARGQTIAEKFIKNIELNEYYKHLYGGR